MPDLAVRPYRIPVQETQSLPSGSYDNRHKSALPSPPLSVGPVKYSFAPVVSPGTSMVALVASSSDDRPAYYISTTLNVFMPMSYITTVYKGEIENLDKVGEFEMGVSTSASVEIQKSREALKSIITRFRGGQADGVWYWTPRNAPDKHLEWNYDSSILTARCFSRRTRHLLATYRYSEHIVAMPSRIQELEVTPDGQGFFDHLLLSLLIIERKRLTPRQSILSRLWNF